MTSESSLMAFNDQHPTDEATRKDLNKLTQKERYQLENQLEEKLMVSKLTQYERIIIGAVRRDTLMFNRRMGGQSFTRME